MTERTQRDDELHTVLMLVRGTEGVVHAGMTRGLASEHEALIRRELPRRWGTRATVTFVYMPAAPTPRTEHDVMDAVRALEPDYVVFARVERDKSGFGHMLAVEKIGTRLGAPSLDHVHGLERLA